MRLFLGLAVFLGAVGLSTDAQAKAPCEMKDSFTLSLRGAIEKDDMLPCVKALDLSKLETIILNSGGGDVETAMDVGDIIAPYKPHMIIKKRCHSSCSNYWLPLARKITFEKKARILIHGGIDPGIMERTRETQGDDADISFVQDLIDMQDDYLARHNIPRGWVMYREKYTKGGSRFAPWLLGEADIPEGTERVKFIMVGEAMLSSCLPDIEIENFGGSYASRADRKRWKKLAKKGQVSSGSLVCAGLLAPNYLSPQ